MEILSVHATHKNMSLKELECWTRLGDDELNAILERENVEEYVVLKTCHRLEVYAVVRDLKRTRDGFASLAERMNAPNIVFRENLDSVRHLMGVCAGLDSMIVGEQEVQRQVKDALEGARARNTSGKVLNYIFMKVLSTGKEVREKTRLASGVVSIPQLSIRLFESRFRTRQKTEVCVVGTGKLSGTVLKSLAGKGATVTVAGRRKSELVRLSNEFGVKTVALDALKPNEFDCLITAVSAPVPLISIQPGWSKPELVIDLGNPRNVNAAQGESYIDLERLNGFARENMTLRKNEVSKAERIIDEKVASVSKKLRAMENEGVAYNLN